MWSSRFLDPSPALVSNREANPIARTNMRVAFLRLGIMGQPMAANLAKAGHDVVAWNRTPGKTVEGARIAATPAEAAADAEVVWMCVSDTAAVNQVLWGENGAGSA